MWKLSAVLIAYASCAVQGEYYLGQQGQSCDQTCRALGRVCAAHMNTGDSTDLFAMVGVDCTREASHNGGRWWANDQPCYVSGQAPRQHQCLGWKDVPASVPCGGRHPAVRRLCRCVQQLPDAYVMGRQGESCSATCGRVGRTCDPHIDTENSDAVFATLGIDCTREPAHNEGRWWAHDQPCYVSGSDPRQHQCLGWRNVPATVNCNAAHRAVRRVCNCPAKYPGSYVLGLQGESCTRTCQRRGKTCVPRIDTENSDAVFATLGVNCDRSPAHNGGRWWAHDQPCYVSGSDPRQHQCLGWRDVPATVNCNAAHGAVRRVCNCQ